MNACTRSYVYSVLQSEDHEEIKTLSPTSPTPIFTVECIHTLGITYVAFIYKPDNCKAHALYHSYTRNITF